MRIVWISLRTSLALAVVVVLLYQGAVLGFAQAVTPDKANGSLIYNDRSEAVGSRLIGQAFTDPKLFHGRISSIGYDAAGSGSPNYAPSNKELAQRTKDAVEAWTTANPEVPAALLPIDLVTNSGSGLDPDISPEAAQAQIPRISKLTGIPGAELEKMIEARTHGRAFGIFGEPGVNVLLLNLDLQRKLTE